MSINLQKGQRESIQSPKFIIGLGWDTNSTSTGSAFDLDASAFILGENGKILSNQHFVFYNNLKSPNDAVVHTGDNLTGDGDGDDEQIIIDLSKIENEASEISIIVTIHDAIGRNQNFGQIRNSFIRIADESSNQELLKYELEEDFSIETAVEFGRVYRKNGEWKFEAVGAGMKGGLEDYLNKYN
ncbi:TerD family protein [Elizabethkingia anophelis]|uniref:TerD family protein n=1 Tax=Elizabethkingia anophelis TaxID=1117645 RepID=UPI000C6CD757|nr:TerD family protein [Elizabethkingia anophelis]PKR31116.1 chemical-damaging agent resistance protein C [Elizabethkingia anophelis]PKR36763.1 chemical-damaging agent resistance protein C [Elizabethkingia anophelis]PRQ79708.1 chemical-damaging agent resistance protein C [Elizabethkingia anophelis]PRQ84057.1 chemical-damaging agent resistance protein C [Elizabethkingia anophelis]PRQ85752.1 chemical-damaging agent resistance protein C [Elizabethkingia anophelis]